MRTIKTHVVNGLNESLLIGVLDDPGHGGASHQYQIRKFVRNEDDSTADVELVQIHFQNGPIAEHGVNGVSQEALLAIVRDRLDCFQRGPFACHENQMALEHIIAAMASLRLRTRDRIARGVEGTSLR